MWIFHPKKNNRPSNLKVSLTQEYKGGVCCFEVYKWGLYVLESSYLSGFEHQPLSRSLNTKLPRPPRRCLFNNKVLISENPILEIIKVVISSNTMSHNERKFTAAFRELYEYCLTYTSIMYRSLKKILDENLTSNIKLKRLLRLTSSHWQFLFFYFL